MKATTNDIAISIYATHRYPIKLGHTGENKALRVVFSLIPFQEAFPGGRPALLVRSKGDAQAYPVTLTVEGDTAYWTVTAADTAAAGFGQCELQWYAGDTLAKSDKFDFLVVQALEAGAEPPDDPSKRWFESVVVRYDIAQNLTEDQQAQARENITAVFDDGTDLFASFYNAGLFDALQEPNGAFLTSGNAVLTY